MKENMQKILTAFLIGFVMFFGAFKPAESAQPGPPEAGKTEVSVMQPDLGYLEDIAFEKMQGKERVALIVSKQPASLPYIEYQAGGAVLLKLENMFVPEGLRRPLGEGKLTNIIIVSPIQKTFEGKQWVYLTIALKERVPYSIRQEGQKVLIDFNVTSLAEEVPPIIEKPVTVKKKDEKTPPKEQKIQEPSDLTKVAFSAREEEKFSGDRGKRPQYSGHKISLDFQDANIKSVFRLLAELSGTSIVCAPDIKGNITINMKSVPWDQALDTILAIQGLSKVQTGNVITVMTLEKVKKDEADRKTVEADQWKAEDERKEREKKLLIEKGKLRQINIEAKIVEANTQFARNLGVSWGYGYKDTWSGRDIGVMFGSSASGALTTFPNGMGFTNSNLAVNFPSVAAADVAAPAIGLITGSSKFILDAKLEALEGTGEGKIISLPKVTTMDGVKALIKQGQQVPIVTPGTANEPPTVTFKDALLKLEVKPTITAEGKISMEINASNDYPIWEKQVAGNPPINTSMVESTVVIGDGDTIVIGGVLQTLDIKNMSGVPWLSRIPFLGWLFKQETTTREKRELLIFVTPKIIKEEA